MSKVHLDVGPVSVLAIELRKNMSTSDINEVGMRTHYRLLLTGAGHRRASRLESDDTYGRDTTGRRSLKRDVKKSAVEFWGSAYSTLLR